MKLKGLFQRKDTGVWCYQPPQVRGIRARPVSLHTTDEAIAAERYLQLAGQMSAALTPSKASFECARYLVAKRTSRSHGRRGSENAEDMVNLFIRFAGDRLIQEYQQADLERWRNTLFASGCSDDTVKTYLSRVRAWFNWLKREGLIKVNPAHGLDLPRTGKTRANLYCLKEERDHLLQASMARPEMAFVAWSGFMAGLRMQEIVEARPHWFDLSAGVLTVQRTETFTPKDKEVRQIALSPRYLEFLDWYGLREPFMLMPEAAKRRVNRGGKRPRYRYDPKRPFRAMVEAAGLGWVRPHMMRHTFATLLIQAGVPLAQVARWMGDDERTTFRHYYGYVRTAGMAGAAD